MTEFLEVTLWVVGIYWVLPFTISMIYGLWLWKVSHDITYEGYILWRGVFPAFRFRLISQKSWYARAWARWYGCALFMLIIHKDEKGEHDDRMVEKVIVHEMRHVAQEFVLGILQWILYGLHYAYLAIFTDKNPYRENWFERDARAATARWVLKGRPRIFNFGRRQ